MTEEYLNLIFPHGSQYTVKRCIDVSRTWNMLLSASQHDGTTVNEYMKLLQKYTDEMVELFHHMNWEEQISVALGSNDYVWVSCLDSDQKAAYLIARD